MCQMADPQVSHNVATTISCGLSFFHAGETRPKPGEGAKGEFVHGTPATHGNWQGRDLGYRKRREIEFRNGSGLQLGSNYYKVGGGQGVVLK